MSELTVIIFVCLFLLSICLVKWFITNILTRTKLFKCKSEGMILHRLLYRDGPNDNVFCRECDAEWKLDGYYPSQCGEPMEVYSRIIKE